MRRQQPNPPAVASGGQSLGDFGVSLIEALGGQPTTGGQRLFNAWQRREGGWSANKATFNPLNLTAPGSGFPTINSVGVVAMPSYDVGVKRTASLLKSGYPALASALASGQVSFQDPAVQADLNRWVSGKRTPGVSPYVSGIAKAFGANLPAAQVTGVGSGSLVPPGSTPTPPPAPQPPVFNPQLFGQNILQQFATGGGRINIGSLPQIRQASFTQSPLKAVPPEQAQQQGIVSPGGSLQDPTGADANLAVKAASTQIGKPYVFGSGPSTSSFDCSDLIQWSYKQMGIDLPRTTFQQVKVGQAVDPRQGLQPGDLIFPSPHHVVMYVGDGKVIAAPHTGTVVQYQPLSQFGKLYAVRRVLR